MLNGLAHVLSKEALRRFVFDGIPNATLCNANDEAPDAAKEMAKCLRNVGVQAGDSRDKLGRNTFVPYSIRKHFDDFKLS